MYPLYISLPSLRLHVCLTFLSPLYPSLIFYPLSEPTLSLSLSYHGCFWLLHFSVPSECSWMSSQWTKLSLLAHNPREVLQNTFSWLVDNSHVQCGEEEEWTLHVCLFSLRHPDLMWLWRSDPTGYKYASLWCIVLPKKKLEQSWHK